ncbi:hypothetical protein OGATHE_006571 [Ogataea polymorpha]|uniref:Uncharacterized protein n=1 Tax=Ogataea polymorpha TaxID=460523 RepID=A0A9P8NS13_9ASCO|nr:hypothetical protein OGATHE_006571 [Ogataea polymorpha]
MAHFERELGARLGHNRVELQGVLLRLLWPQLFIENVQSPSDLADKVFRVLVSHFVQNPELLDRQLHGSIHHGQKRVIVQLQQNVGVFWCRRPHQACPVVWERQQRHRTAWQKSLPPCRVSELTVFKFESSNYTPPVIRPATALNLRKFPHWRVVAVATDKKPCFEGLAAGQLQHRPSINLVACDVLDLGVVHNGRFLVQFLNPCQQCRLEIESLTHGGQRWAVEVDLGSRDPVPCNNVVVALDTALFDMFPDTNV